MSSKSVLQECQESLSIQSVLQKCQESVSSQSVLSKCQTRVSSQECRKNVSGQSVSSKRVSQEFCAIVSSKSVLPECQIIVSCQGVPQLCPVENVIIVSCIELAVARHMFGMLNQNVHWTFWLKTGSDPAFCEKDWAVAPI